MIRLFPSLTGTLNEALSRENLGVLPQPQNFSFHALIGSEDGVDAEGEGRS